MDFVFVSDNDFPNLDIIPHTLNNSCFCSPHLNDTHKIMEISPLKGYFSDLDWTPQSPYPSNELPDWESWGLDFILPPLGEDLEELDQKPLNSVVPQGFHCNQEKGFGDALWATENVSATCVKKEKGQIIDQRPLVSSSSTKKRPCALEFEEISRYFGVTINEAAKQMNVGVTMLKKRCRELNIMRWPCRKIKSLQMVINKVKEMGLEEEVARLEEHKKLLEKLPGLELSEEAKKLRQACFKANYKKRRCTALQA